MSNGGGRVLAEIVWRKEFRVPWTWNARLSSRGQRAGDKVSSVISWGCLGGRVNVHFSLKDYGWDMGFWVQYGKAFTSSRSGFCITRMIILAKSRKHRG